MKITASQVNELRKQTGAGMMDCKNALVESEGDFDTAVDYLRKKGQKVAAKRGDREAGEGVVMARTTADNGRGVVIKLNCETDFVAKNENFINFATTILEIAIANTPADVDTLKGLAFADSGLSVGDKIIEQIGVIGEKIELASYEVVEASTVFAYNHPGNQLASVVGLNVAGVEGDVAKDVAMQVAAMNPIAVNQDGIAQDVIDREIAVGKEQAIQEGKPAEMAEKIAVGRLNKFFKENTLLNQAYIKDNKKSIQQFLKEVNNDLTVTEFKRVALN